MMKSSPAVTFVMSQSQFLLEFFVVSLACRGAPSLSVVSGAAGILPVPRWSYVPECRPCTASPAP